jgi:hypothetical protein
MTNSVDDKRDKASEHVNNLTQDEFDKEWARLFPLDNDEPMLLRRQTE